MSKILTAILLTLVVFFPVFSQGEKEKSKSIKSISDFTNNLRKIDGYLPLFYDDEKGKMYFEVSDFKKEFLYQISLSTGVGSNPIGLDRGQLGDTKIVYFERIGNKVLLIQPNYRYRALSNNAAEKLAVEESFAKSVVWGFKSVAKSSDRILVDATDFLVRDAHNVGGRLKRTKQGVYSFAKSRSAFYLPRVKGFPKNTEIETIITLTSKGDTGRLVNQVTPSGNAVTTQQRHSFVELPDKNYKPREFDQRIGAFAISFYDYATDIGENLEKRWIVRHRLQKKNPNEKFGEAIEPIVYYVDKGTPKKIQDALIIGASWWNQAFEAAGFKNAFQVKVLPPDADPLDVRYNVINWVHRSTRGWAYGSSIVDPRTGEIIKGVVTLDSQRARQDFLIASAFAPQYSANAMCNFSAMPEIDYLLQTDSKTNADALSVARIRQLSAHEIGHTLGFSHNFAASTYGGRASVMDYPAPLIQIVNGKLDFSNAYDNKIGVYDKWVTQFAYTDFPNTINEKAELEKILQAGISKDYLYISDADTRPASSAHPLANLWDNGNDPIAELKHIMRVRKIGLNQFGLKNVAEKMPLAELENKLLPLYLHHRYQMTATVKMLGGVYYSYAVRNGNSASPNEIYKIVPAQKQREAMNAVLETLDTKELAIPQRILKLIPPTASRSNRAELFPKRTRPIFDDIGAAEISANMTINALLEPNRAARLISFNARNKLNPHFREVVNALLKRTWYAPVSRNSYHNEVQRAVQNVVVNNLMNLAKNPNARKQVRAIATESLRNLSLNLKRKVATGNTRTHYRATIRDIERFLKRPDEMNKQTRPLSNPPGDPIGSN